FSMEDLVASRRPGFRLPDGLADRLTFLQTPSDLCAHLLARRHGLERPPILHVSACAAGTDAIGAAFRAVATGHADFMLPGATVHAEIAGYGNSFDAHGISEPHPEAKGAVAAMSRALADAGLEPGAIDAVSAHGTSTPKNDPVETLALRRLLGERARSVPVF